jgi:hypothetical protein
VVPARRLRRSWPALAGPGLGLAALAFAAPRAKAPTPDPADVFLSAQEDYRRRLDLPHIKELRPGADGRNPQAPNAANSPLVDGALAWRRHEGGHTIGPNGPLFLDFAQRHFTPSS